MIASEEGWVLQNENYDEIFEKMGEKVPNSFVTLGIGYGIGIFISIVLIIGLFLISLVTPIFSESNWFNIKFILLITFCALISGIPVVGIYFAIALLLQKVVELTNLLTMELNSGVWFVSIIYFLFSLGMFLFNTVSQIYIIFIVKYPSPELKKKNQIYSILILIISTIIGIIVILVFDEMFLSLATTFQGL